MGVRRAYRLYKLISQNQKISARRHPLMEQNSAMKFVVFLILGFWAIYLMCLGVAVSLAFRGSSREAFDWLDGGMVYILVADFFLRFTFQETPAQEIKPYKLLPIPQRLLLHVFLVRIGFRPYNLFGMFFLIPFALFSVVGFWGFTGLVTYLAGWILMFVANSYWYLLWRTLILRQLLYALCPLAIYAGLIYFGLYFDDGNPWLFNACALLGRGFCQGDIASYAVPVAVVVLLFPINYKMQERSVYLEIAKSEQTSHVRPTMMGWLGWLGIIGEFIKLEVKSTMRNKTVRKSFLFGVVYMLVFCNVFAFTDLYDEIPFMRTFIFVYSFSCLGTMTLTNILCVEGNYMDLLMSRKESILSLLKAKYYFNCLLLLIPMLFTIMPIVQQKVLVIEALAYAMFTMGCVFPFLFQLAVYNTSTMPMNNKITQTNRSTKTQLIYSTVALSAPLLLMYLLVVVFSTEVASGIMLVFGLGGFIANPLWLRNIYQRLMARRYKNLEKFRQSRQG